jgi:hypothetical protein
MPMTVIPIFRALLLRPVMGKLFRPAWQLLGRAKFTPGTLLE